MLILLVCRIRNKCMILQKKKKFDTKAQGNKYTGDRTLIKLLKSPAMMASGISQTIFLPSDPKELCDRLKLLLQEKRGGNNFEIFDEEIIAIVH